MKQWKPISKAAILRLSDAWERKDLLLQQFSHWMTRNKVQPCQISVCSVSKHSAGPDLEQQIEKLWKCRILHAAVRGLFLLVHLWSWIKKVPILTKAGLGLLLAAVYECAASHSWRAVLWQLHLKLLYYLLTHDSEARCKTNVPSAWLVHLHFMSHFSFSSVLHNSILMFIIVQLRPKPTVCGIIWTLLVNVVLQCSAVLMGLSKVSVFVWINAHELFKVSFDHGPSVKLT